MGVELGVVERIGSRPNDSGRAKKHAKALRIGRRQLLDILHNAPESVDSDCRRHLVNTVYVTDALQLKCYHILPILPLQGWCIAVKDSEVEVPSKWENFPDILNVISTVLKYRVYQL